MSGPETPDGTGAGGDLPAAQQPAWPDSGAVAAARTQLATLPPLVYSGEVDRLTGQLCAAAAGESFVLMGGDCAEVFADATADRIRGKVKTLMQVAAVLTYGAQLPVVKLARMAGQYAKPRTSGTETRGDVTLPSYRGDAVNSAEFTATARVADPARMVQAYHSSACVLNMMRALTQGGFADLRAVRAWNQGFLRNAAYAQYNDIADEIDHAIRFVTACGESMESARRVDMYTCHEALLLDYEEPLARHDADRDARYAMSGHFLWAGERTRQLDHAHVAFLSSVANPVGVKLGPGITAAKAVALAQRLNPENTPGRLTFITRMGADHIDRVLPELIRGVRAAGLNVLWVCDPMHGNTFTSSKGYKTRRFNAILAEVHSFFDIHHQHGTWPGGIHIELTGDDVTEVLGGCANIDDDALSLRYESACDPRLNHEQSLELAFLIARKLQAR